MLNFRAKIERENKDIKLEKIRVKAAEQRETVLQSIKWVLGLNIILIYLQSLLI